MSDNESQWLGKTYNKKTKQKTNDETYEGVGRGGVNFHTVGSRQNGASY